MTNKKLEEKNSTPEVKEQKAMKEVVNTVGNVREKLLDIQFEQQKQELIEKYTFDIMNDYNDLKEVIDIICPPEGDDASE